MKCFALAVLLVIMLTLVVAAEGASADLRYDHQNDTERLEICHAVLLGESMGMWAIASPYANGFDNGAKAVDQSNHFKLKLLPDPHKVKHMVEALSALRKYDNICQKRLSPTQYVGYRIGVEESIIQWTCSTKVDWEGRERVLSSFKDLIVDITKLGIPKELVDRAKSMQDSAKKVGDGHKLIDACFPILTWSFRVSDKIGDIDMEKYKKK